MKRFAAIIACTILFTVLSGTAYAQRGLDKPLHNLMVITMPTGAAVFIDGNPIRGNSAQVPEGTHTITVTREGYADWTKTVNISRNTMLTASLQKATGYSLSVTANVKDAQVFVNNGLVGPAPLNTSLARGTYTIRVSAPGYTDFSTTVNLTGNQTLNAVLQPAAASISLNIPDYLKRQNARGPGGGDFRIFADDRPMQDHKFQLPPGVHTIRIAGGSFVLEQEFYFEAGRNYDIDLIIGMMIR